MANNIKSALINFLRFLPRWTLAGGGIFTFAINIMMHYVSVLHTWAIVFGLGCLVSGCQVNRLSVKPRNAIESAYLLSSHRLKAKIGIPHCPDPVQVALAMIGPGRGWSVDFYCKQGALLLPSSILSEIADEDKLAVRQYIVTLFLRDIARRRHCAEDCSKEAIAQIYNQMDKLCKNNSATLTQADKNMLKTMHINLEEWKKVNALVDGGMEASNTVTFTELKNSFIDQVIMTPSGNSPERCRIEQALNIIVSSLFKDKEYVRRQVHQLYSDFSGETKRELTDYTGARRTYICEHILSELVQLYAVYDDVDELGTIYLASKRSGMPFSRLIAQYREKINETWNKEHPIPDVLPPDLLDIKVASNQSKPSTSQNISKRKKPNKNYNPKHQGKQFTKDDDTTETTEATSSIFDNKKEVREDLRLIPIENSMHKKKIRVSRWEKSEEWLLANAPIQFPEYENDANSISIQKRWHDLSPVECLLDQLDASNYFFGRNNIKSAFAELEYYKVVKGENGSKVLSGSPIIEEGVVDIAIEKGNNKIYHQEFRQVKPEWMLKIPKCDKEACDDDALEHNKEACEEDEFQPVCIKGRSIRKEENAYVINFLDKNVDPKIPYKTLRIFPCNKLDMGCSALHS